jgi:hypothetical protein
MDITGQHASHVELVNINQAVATAAAFRAQLEGT